MYASPARSTAAPPSVVMRPIRWSNPSQIEMERHINLKASLDGDVILSRHAAQDRLDVRGFSKADILDMLCRGHAYKLEAGSRPSEWKVNLSRKVRGRDAAVCVAVSPNAGVLYVLTVMWLDRPV